MTDVKACEICLGRLQTRLFSKRGYDIVRCDACGHIWLPLAETDETLHRAYEQFFTDGAYLDYVADRRAAARNFARFIGVLRRFQPNGRLFEVGSAYGFFLDLARSHWQVEGIDISPAATAYARSELGLDVACGEFLEHPVEVAAYDAIVMWDTIEHLRAPRAYLQKIATMLKPGGILALTTGDVGRLMPRLRGPRWRLYDPPFHLQYFTRGTLARLLRHFAFDVVQVQSTGYFRSVGFMLHRLLMYGKPPGWRRLYRAAEWTGLTDRIIYLNVFDIMMVVARKQGDR